jgi:hypothetical protein
MDRAGVAKSLQRASKPALGPTHPPVQWVREVKWLEREANNSPPSSAEVENLWACISTPPICLHGRYLMKQEILLHGMVLS